MKWTSNYSTELEALGWTLLNSVWQSLAIFAITVILLRLIPTQKSLTRYYVSCAALLTLVVVSVITYSVIYQPANAHVSAIEWKIASTGPTTNLDNNQDWLHSPLQFIEANMNWIIAGWMLGAALFSLRLVSGWVYLFGLKKSARDVPQFWVEKMRELRTQLSIEKNVRFMESSRISVPIVVGFLKPVVLIPAAMLSGLTPRQVETVLMHELAHIRRNDFLVNFFQTVLESIFFFNPFVWKLSAIIRREREFCCDDEVVQANGEAIVYAQALATLEEMRLSGVTLGLSLAEDKNVLLNRIRRIMERSARNYTSRERVVPAVLVVLGLVCASWLTIRTDQGTTYGKTASLEQDTIKDQNFKSARASRTTVITIDENGKPHEEIVENFEGDDELREFVFDVPFDVAAPMSPPVMAFRSADMPRAFGIPDQFGFQFDTVPSPFHRRDWEEFSQEFRERFAEQFKGFYKDNQAEFDKVMKEMEKDFAHRFNREEFLQLDALQEAIEVPIHALALTDLHALEESRMALEEIEEIRMNHEHVELAQLDQLREMELSLSEHSADLRELELTLAETENQMRAFEKEVAKMLIEDGYLKKGDEIKTFKREDNGKMEVNGKKIKEADLDRYHALHRKYFKPGFHHWNIE